MQTYTNIYKHIFNQPSAQKKSLLILTCLTCLLTGSESVAASGILILNSICVTLTLTLTLTLTVTLRLTASHPLIIILIILIILNRSSRPRTP